MARRRDELDDLFGDDEEETTVWSSDNFASGPAAVTEAAAIFESTVSENSRPLREVRCELLMF